MAPCATSSTGYFDQDVGVDVAPLLTVGFEKSGCTLILASGVDRINEIALIVVAKHQFEHEVGCLVYSVIIAG